MCQDISLKSCVCSPWPAPRVACPNWKGITTRQSSVRSLRGTRSWPACTSDTTSSLATKRTSQVLPTGILAEWGFVFRGSWILWLWTATPPAMHQFRLADWAGRQRQMPGHWRLQRPGQQLGAGLRVLIAPTHRPDRQQWLHRVERWIFHPHTRPLGSEAVGYRPDPRDSRYSQWCGVGSRCGFFVVRRPAHHSQLRLLSREGDCCYHQQVQLRPGQLGLVHEPSGNRRENRRRCWPRRNEPTNSFLHSGSRQGCYTGDRWWAVTVEQQPLVEQRMRGGCQTQTGNVQALLQRPERWDSRKNESSQQRLQQDHSTGQEGSLDSLRGFYFGWEGGLRICVEEDQKNEATMRCSWFWPATRQHKVHHGPEQSGRSRESFRWAQWHRQSPGGQATIPTRDGGYLHVPGARWQFGG